MATKHTFQENVLRVVAVVGLIAVLLLGAWGIIQLAFYIPTLFGGGGSTSAKETLTVSAPMGVTSGATFPVYWTHKGQDKNQGGEYAYTLSYSCASGVTLKAPVPTGAMQAVPCNTPFNYLNATTSTGVSATLSGTAATPLTITVSATKLSTGAVTASATANTTVNPAPKAASAVKTSALSSGASAKYVASGRTQNLYGYPDLAVYMTSNSGQVRAGSRVSMQFVIQNIGTNAAPSGWAFTATLPYNPVYTYQSAPQQALYPGDKIVYTLTYDAQSQYANQYSNTYDSNPCAWTYPCSQSAPIYGGPGTCNAYGPCNIPSYINNPYSPYIPGFPTYQQTASVQADAYSQVWESNESNNYGSITYTVY